MSQFNHKTAIITGASRGIGRAIALELAKQGANIVIMAKSDQPHPLLPGTIHSVADEVEQCGGKALALAVDIRDDVAVAAAVETTAETFGGVDIVVNNASAISLTPTLETPPKRYDLMTQINTRGTYVVTQAALPFLLESPAAHVLTLSPPVTMKPQWFAAHPAYTLSKFGMSMLTYGWAAEFHNSNIGFNCLWPATLIATAAMKMIPSVDVETDCRTEQIVADAAMQVFMRDPKTCSGNFFTDEQLLKEAGIESFEQYNVSEHSRPKTDGFLDENVGFN